MAASAPKSLETLGKCFGCCRAEQCVMQSVPDSDPLNQVERLVGELRAIELWDAGYWRKCPEAYEMVAFVARRKRRAEILSQLVPLIPRLDIKEQRCLWIVRKSSTRRKQKTGVTGGLSWKQN
jgi:hypothetical protein